MDPTELCSCRCHYGGAISCPSCKNDHVDGGGSSGDGGGSSGDGGGSSGDGGGSSNNDTICCHCKD